MFFFVFEEEEEEEGEESLVFVIFIGSIEVLIKGKMLVKLLLFFREYFLV